MRYEAAISQARRAVDYDLKNTNNLYFLGLLYEKNLDFASAEQWINKALEILDQPLNLEYRKLATVLNRQNKHGEAIAALQKAIAHNPRDEAAQFAMATTKDAYYQDIDAKIKAYELFLKKFPKSVYVSNVNIRIQELKQEKFMKTE